MRESRPASPCAHNSRLPVKSDPALQQAARRWQTAKKDLDDLRLQVRSEMGQATAEGAATVAPADPAQALARLRVQVDVLKGYKQTLEESVNRLQKEIRDLGKGSMYVEDKREEISIANEFARKVGAEMEFARVELSAPPRVKILSDASPPRLKGGNSRIKASAMASLASFVLGVLGVSLWEFRARRVDLMDELVSGLGLNIVGSLPGLPRSQRARSSKLGLDRRWQSLLVESIDSTRTMILHAASTNAVRVVMVTSPNKGEGKTALSCHLATSLARAGRKTLLIDADLRQPSCHRMLGEEPGPGLCECLRGEVSLADAIRPSISPSLCQQRLRSPAESHP